uniref:Uncharacterized protein n=1 Tax=Meloidogyne enterolobii TaxID=390850 RepID=A0A6V7UCH5_MELEN|nr:unnamed protein product [Meloidogyne enterolobii]
MKFFTKGNLDDCKSQIYQSWKIDFSPSASAKGYLAAGSEPASSVTRTDVLTITTRRLLHILTN